MRIKEVVSIKKILDSCVLYIEMPSIYDFLKKLIELLELRKKFEEDKQKIAKLKESRRFKPY